ncbi:hypothetical protein L596_002609 [Steinernema carpocapsae]|uniref:C-type lectin domain-containing protein n=1 Tax=Steinernema carpocapsae TaxID=34508 RepID=A0A4U8URL5_STECR|nr:hypothetical protein L596_002609 [Steinernema carpocapsae]
MTLCSDSAVLTVIAMLWWSTLLLSLTLLFADSSARQGCFGGFAYSALQRKCVKIFSDHITQNEAEASCQLFSGHLISVDSAFRNAEVHNFVRNQPSCGKAWIGVAWSNGSYRWTDGTPFRYNNFATKLSEPKACGVSEKYDYVWDSVSCSQELCYVCEKSINTPSDCMDLKEAGNTESGTYEVSDGDGNMKQVYCDMETQGGGWTVIQRRENGKLRFWDRTWDEYKNGFGSLCEVENCEFWIGNEIISRISSKDNSVTLRVDLWGDRAPYSSHANDYYYSEYTFKLDNESSNFTIHIKEKWPGVGNASTGWYDITYSNRRPFSTIDRINDPRPECVTQYHLRILTLGLALQTTITHF